MRKLNKDEKELTEKGIKRLDGEIDELDASLEYNRDILAKQKYLREFEDKWRSYLRNQKDVQDDKMLIQLNDMLEEKKHAVEQMIKQLKEGVEEKTPSRVK